MAIKNFDMVTIIATTKIYLFIYDLFVATKRDNNIKEITLVLNIAGKLLWVTY